MNNVVVTPKQEENFDESQSEDDYQALSNREEYDLERLMHQCEFTIDNAQAFTEQLSKEVGLMDAQNIERIMESGKKVELLMSTLNVAVEETLKLEQRFDNYQNYFKNVKDVILQVDKKENQVKIEQDNKKKLELYIENLIDSLNFPNSYVHSLLENDLTSKQGIRECIKAAEVLHSKLNPDIHSSIKLSIAGVQEQKAFLETIQHKFSERLTHHLLDEYENYIKSYLNDSTNLINTRDLSLPKHDLIHNGLFIYRPLVKWLNSNDLECFIKLTDKYEAEIKYLYDREIIEYFELIKEKMSGNKVTISNEDKHRKINLGIGLNQDFIPSSNSSFSSGNTNFRLGSSSFHENFDTASSKDSEVSLSEWEEFDSCVERILSSIDPVCSSEQNFCMQFFNVENTQNISSTQNNNLHRRTSNVSTSVSIAHSISNESQNSNEIIEKKQKSLREMMARIFEMLEKEFINFVNFYDNLDGFYSMYLLVRLTQHVLSAEDKGSFLAKTYGKILINVKRNFDKFMNSQLIAIEQAKVTKKSKHGILQFIKNFENFAKQAEKVYKNSGARRKDIDKWYEDLIKKIFEMTEVLAKQHHKTPEEMVLLENYHYLHNVLSTLKIACLEQEKKEAKLKYNEALKNYVSRYFGRPLEKLNIFFEEVRIKLSQGVKEEEVGYHFNCSKEELRKKIDQCNLKEVKKGLEEMYRKVEKHISDPNSTLIQVIWRSMQEEFISQYKAIENLIERCYKGSNIRLSFTVENVLNVFSEIARSH